jgi:ABC-2 type transport system permease protein
VTDARIIDRGYRPYDGPRRGQRGAVLSLARATAQRVMGLRRPARAKILPILAAAIAYVPAIVFIGVAALINDPRVRNNVIPQYADYYGFITSALVIFACFVAPEALCPDRRTGLLGMYLAAPLTRGTYLASKAGTIFSLLLVATLGPPLLMVIAFVLQGLGPNGPGEVAVLLLRVLVSGLLVAAIYTSISLGISSLTDKRALAAAGTLLTIIMSGSITGILHEGLNAPDWVLAFNLTAAPFQLVQRIYGRPSDIPGVATWMLVATTLGYTALGLGVAWWRYRRLRVAR